MHHAGRLPAACRAAGADSIDSFHSLFEMATAAATTTDVSTLYGDMRMNVAITAKVAHDLLNFKSHWLSKQWARTAGSPASALGSALFVPRVLEKLGCDLHSR